LFLNFQAFRLIWLRDNYKINCIEIDYSDTDVSKGVILFTYLYIYIYFNMLRVILLYIVNTLYKSNCKIIFIVTIHKYTMCTKHREIYRFSFNFCAKKWITVNTVNFHQIFILKLFSKFIFEYILNVLSYFFKSIDNSLYRNSS
jgi:hypothetical protein